MKKIKIRADVFDCRGDGNPFIRLQAGSLHDEDEQSLRELALGNAEVVEVEDPVPQAEQSPSADESKPTQAEISAVEAPAAEGTAVAAPKSKRAAAVA